MPMKIAVLLSGGVDSSVALALLKKAGHRDITAFYLKIWLEDDMAYMGSCPWEEDLSYARAVCESMDVPLEVIPLQTQYYQRVVSYALEELRKGNTPSPDIFCNERVKFGAFFEEVGDRFDKVATGHYGRIDWLPMGGDRGLDPMDPLAGKGEGRWRLLRAPDPVKDQSYFLSHLDQSRLSRIVFPVGNFLKGQVRKLAAEWELANRNRPDSQGICFLGKIKYPDFVRYYLGEKEGPIVNADTGDVLGTHKGTWFHTTGQRTGLGLGNGPWYVRAADRERNIIYAGHQVALQAALRTRLSAHDFRWTAGAAPEDLVRGMEVRLKAKLRHGPQLVDCTVRSQEGRGDRVEVVLDQGDPGVAPGQFCVLYRGEECLGSGTIGSHGDEYMEGLFRTYQERTAALAAEAPVRRRKRTRTGGGEK